MLVVIAAVLVLSLLHFLNFHARRGWGRFVHPSAVQRASDPVLTAFDPSLLLWLRASVAAYCAGLLVWSVAVNGPDCLRFFTFWNFILLTLFFALGAVLSTPQCRRAAALSPSRTHEAAAAGHALLLEIELPVALLIGLMVWFVLLPADPDAPADLDEKYFNLGSLTMHAANSVLLAIEFGLDGLTVHASSFGLVLAWCCTFALFTGLDSAVTGSPPIYFFLDLTQSTSPPIGAALVAAVGACFAAARAASVLKWRLAARLAARSTWKPPTAAGLWAPEPPTCALQSSPNESWSSFTLDVEAAGFNRSHRPSLLGAAPDGNPDDGSGGGGAPDDFTTPYARLGADEPTASTRR